METKEFLDFAALQNALGIEAESFEVYLQQIFLDLSEINEAKLKQKSDEDRRISKSVLLQYFDFPPFINEKWYSIFDRKDTGSVGFESFEKIMTKLFLGQFQDSAEIIFKLYDFDNDGVIKKEDIRLVLSFLPIKESENSSKYKSQLESLGEIQELLKKYFTEEKARLNFSQFLKIIETEKSDIYIHLLCFLYYKKPFEPDTINIIKNTTKNNKYGSNNNTSCNNSKNSYEVLQLLQSSKRIKSKEFPFPEKLKNFLATQSYLNIVIANQSEFSKQSKIISEQYNESSIDINKVSSNLLSSYSSRASRNVTGKNLIS